MAERGIVGRLSEANRRLRGERKAARKRTHPRNMESRFGLMQAKSCSEDGVPAVSRGRTRQNVKSLRSAEIAELNCKMARQSKTLRSAQTADLSYTTKKPARCRRYARATASRLKRMHPPKRAPALPGPNRSKLWDSLPRRPASCGTWCNHLESSGRRRWCGCRHGSGSIRENRCARDYWDERPS